jgi:uncharacterized protein YdeI (BOF family)
MKKLIIAIVALVFSMGAMAQSRMSTSQMKDGFVMTKGKMMMIQGGRISAMDQDKTLGDGTKVTTNGTVTMSGGKTTVLNNGDFIDMTGHLQRSMKKDSVMMEPKQ